MKDSGIQQGLYKRYEEEIINRIREEGKWFCFCHLFQLNTKYNNLLHFPNKN